MKKKILAIITTLALIPLATITFFTLSAKNTQYTIITYIPKNIEAN